MSKIGKILLVEDDLRLNETLRELFVAWGFEVEVATDGERAVHKLEAGAFNLVISDLHMPEMDGLELLTHIRSKPEFDNLPFIMITADPVQEHKIKSLENGVNDYVFKPFSIKELILKAQNILKVIDAGKERSKSIGTDFPVHIRKRIEDTMLNRIESYLKEHLSQSMSIDEIADYCGVSRSSLDKRIRKSTGLSSSEYIRNFRLEKAHQLIENSQLSVKEISQLTGFNSLSYFSTCFSRRFGVNPNKQRQKAMSRK